MAVRILIFLGLALLLFLPFNVVTYRQLVHIHPRRRRWVRAALIAGNVMWLFFPMLRSFTPFARFTRAVFAPPWFGWTVFTILYSALLFLILVAWIPFRARMPFARFARWPSRLFLWIVIVGFVIGFYQALVPLRVDRVTMRVANLPPSLEGVRIALIGDLHTGLFTRRSRLHQIFATTAAAKPDLVLLAGDLIDDDPFFTAKLLGGVDALPPSVPVYAVYGNHEMYGDPYGFAKELRGTRVRLLLNEGALFRDLWIAGISDPAASDKVLRPDLAKALAAKPANAIALAVAHQPRVVDEARRLRVPITLCAHTHGGQLGFRPLGWSLAGVFLRYHMGYYDLPPTQLYITTGAGYWVFPFRLGMEPEVSVIELVRR